MRASSRTTSSASAAQQPAAARLKRSLKQRAGASRPGAGARKPHRSSKLAGFVPARVWAWTPRQGARRYLVRFFWNGRQVFRGVTDKAQLLLPRRFRFHAGRYRWRVVANPHSRPAIVDASFVLSAKSAGAANNNR